MVAVLAGLSIITLFLAGPLIRRVWSFQQLRERSSDVEVSDGIQENEAELIAGEYSRLLLGSAGACSGTTAPALADGAWKAEILFGFGGERTGHWITVDPIRGGVSSPGGPQ